MTSHDMIDELITRPSDAARIVRERSRSATEVLAAVWVLYGRCLAPVADALAEGDAPGHRYFDLDDVAGTRISGLALGVMASDIPSLSAHLSDEEISARFAEYGFDVARPEGRRRLFDVWIAERASAVCAVLLDLLAETHLDGVERARARVSV